MALQRADVHAQHSVHEPSRKATCVSTARGRTMGAQDKGNAMKRTLRRAAAFASLLAAMTGAWAVPPAAAAQEAST